MVPCSLIGVGSLASDIGIREGWLQPDALGKLADRWLRLARWEPKAVDAVIKFAKCAPREWQARIALTWIDTILDERYDLIANHLWFLDKWLTEDPQRAHARFTPLSFAFAGPERQHGRPPSRTS